MNKAIAELLATAVRKYSPLVQQRALISDETLQATLPVALAVGAALLDALPYIVILL